MHIRYAIGGPKVPDVNDVMTSDKFATLIQRIALSSLPPPDTPYDLYCPSLALEVTKRICKQCKTYFASQEAVKRDVRSNACGEAGETSIKTEAGNGFCNLRMLMNLELHQARKKNLVKSVHMSL